MDGPSPAERIALAQRLISRNKLAEALDVLNEAIRQNARFAPTFECRAVVFDALGMYPQAQADRRKAAGLIAAQGASKPSPETGSAQPAVSGSAEEPQQPAPPPEDESPADGEAALPEFAAEEQQTVEAPEEAIAAPAESGEPPEEPPPPVMPSYPPPRPSIGGALLRAAGVVLFALGAFAVGGVGIYIALNAVGGSDSDEPADGPTESPSPTVTDNGAGNGATATGAATDVPETVEEALSGSPYSFSHLEDAWHARALAVSVGEISESVTGFAEPAVDITLTGDGEAMELSVLIYPSADAKDTEWTVGAKPQPKGAGELPAGSAVWYNANVIVVVRVVAAGLRQDALDGFLALGGATGE
ncbi:MAG TPA: hypothetical protein VIW01_12675 [Dehalococcoidia bacterium]